jgi:hypothetical protein
LASPADVSASSTYYDPLDRRAAFSTRFTFAAVHLDFELKHSHLTLAVQIRTNGGTTRFYRFSEDFPDALV